MLRNAKNCISQCNKQHFTLLKTTFYIAKADTLLCKNVTIYIMKGNEMQYFLFTQVQQRQ